MAGQFLVATYTSKGMVEAITGLDRLNAEVRDMTSIKSQMDTNLAEQMALLSQATPVKTGAMRDAWDAGSEVAEYEYIGRITNDAPHAAFVLEGTGEFGPSDKGSGQMIIAPDVTRSGGPFRFFSTKFNRPMTLWQSRGQGANAALNEIIADFPQESVRAFDRVLRGLLEVAFQSQTQPGIIVHGG